MSGYELFECPSYIHILNYNIVWGICCSAVFNSFFSLFVLLLIPTGILILLLCFTSYIFCLCTS